jgi:2-epi-5-epi-valiolone synthase
MPLERTGDRWTVTADHRVTYRVHLVDDLLTRTFPVPVSPTAGPDLLGRAHGPRHQPLVLADRTVMRTDMHGPQLHTWFTRNGIEPTYLKLKAGERTKGWRDVKRILRAIDRAGIQRHAPPVRLWCVGGGVTTDKGGVAASVYRRGIHRINLPTTLVGMIDAALAAKTAIDFLLRKNRLGTYYPADEVLIDRRFLRTLALRRISDGLAEIVKIAVALDPLVQPGPLELRLFETLELYGSLVLSERFQGDTPEGDRAALLILEGAIDGILAQLAPNLFELNSARESYLGHNFPDIEMSALHASRSLLPWRRRPWLYHGEAVGLDTLIAAGIAVDEGLLAESNYDRIASLLESLGLPTWDPLLADEDLLWNSLEDTTRHRGGQQLFTLPAGIGSIEFSNDITRAKIRRAVARQRRLGGTSIVPGRMRNAA